MNRHIRHAAALVAGFALDAVLGDPHGWPHPVVPGEYEAFQIHLKKI